MNSTSYQHRHVRDAAAAQRLIRTLDVNAAAVDADAKSHQPDGDAIALARVGSAAEYFALRQKLVDHEKSLDFAHSCRLAASPLERDVDALIQRLKQQDATDVYQQAEPRRGCGGQLHPRFAGDHFLSNEPLIARTRLFQVASMMPKGAHLHIHFNACLLPHVLLDIAKGMDRMFITSDMPLVPTNSFENLEKCELQFSILSPENESPGNIFSNDYQPRQTMRYTDFLEQFPRYCSSAKPVEQWLMDKLVFSEEEAHGSLQTATGAWEKFNGRTRMMKGLFNYETAYRRYTRLCLEDFVKDNIQYAEIRPNFMRSNQLYTDDGSGTIDNEGIMRIIIDEVRSFQADARKRGLCFGGLKVIYCTPRSFPPPKVKEALLECIEFKKKWPEWIAGFDLVGEEGKGRPLKDFVPEFLEFIQLCNAQRLDIPFLFHCGETLEMGTETDGNLVDALLLNSRRIGHGFALNKHPYIMEQMKARNICLEVCPISNEILGLTPRVDGHSMYSLLANNVHCTVNSDNGTLFRSSLSHDFYQVMVGKADMDLYGWKQLIMWSIEHACVDEAERRELQAMWESQWKFFLENVMKLYGSEVSQEGRTTHL
ncbi:hypothetical protein B0I35DRAFT_356233 [Stachybotrys elegans]|uniref:adenosine deaminase n=1 Tax=Stachybotrys elegans TaxID=80388 RepID=A0A8K0SJG9_9HYPO|nr:hypothetical protein B0I35DRAFT_356233 [Stachybotrys elegans]